MRWWAHESFENLIENQYLALDGHNYLAVRFDSEKHEEVTGSNPLLTNRIVTSIVKLIISPVLLKKEE